MLLACCCWRTRGFFLSRAAQLERPAGWASPPPPFLVRSPGLSLKAKARRRSFEPAVGSLLSPRHWPSSGPASNVNNLNGDPQWRAAAPSSGATIRNDPVNMEGLSTPSSAQDDPLQTRSPFASRSMSRPTFFASSRMRNQIPTGSLARGCRAVAFRSAERQYIYLCVCECVCL